MSALSKLSRFGEIYDAFMTGGIQYSIEAPEQFHERLGEPLPKLPPELQKTVSKTQWVSATLLADGDLTLSISADFVANHSPQELKQQIQDLLTAIDADVERLNSRLRRFFQIIDAALLVLFFTLGALSMADVVAVRTDGYLPAPGQTPTVNAMAPVLLGLGLFRKPLASRLLRKLLKFSHKLKFGHKVPR